MPYTIRALFAFFLALLTGVAAHAQFVDDFSDSDFTSDPTWSGNDVSFTVDGGQLRSNTGVLPLAASYSLSTPSTLANDAQWEFHVDLKFATSGANYVDIYLMSDVEDLSTPNDGYFIRIGETADHVVLNKRVAGVSSLLISSPNDIVNSSTDNPFRIKVTRDAADLWTLFYDDGAIGTYVNAGTATDAEITTSAYFGIRITQSTAAAPANNHFFDDFSIGPIIVDTAPPNVVIVTATNSTNVDVTYSEALNPAAIGVYDILPSIGVSGAALDGMDPTLVHVTPSIALSSGITYSFTATGAEDLAGNVAALSLTDLTWFAPVQAGLGDVVINEIMPDPDPTVGLPNAEFVELFNTTAEAFDLTGWKLTDGSTTGTLPAVQIPPGGFVILSATTSAPLFSGFGTTVGVPSFPSLNNSGDPLQLWDASGATIDAVTYSSAWYNDPSKMDGGWTLERIDPFTPCSGTANWTASNAASGGTPGMENSVFAVLNDTIPPTLAHVFVIDSDTLDLLFNEDMDDASLISGSYIFDPAIGISNLAVMAPDRVRLALATPLTEGVIHTVTVTDVSDCPGNVIGTTNMASFAIPEPIAVGDVVINEVLYDPRGTGSDFVELYNRSQKVVSLAELQLTNASGPLAVISMDAFLLQPGQYLALATDPANVLANYPLGHADRMLQMALPTFNNGSGTVAFLGANGDTLDLFNYADALQFALLKSVDGVSLERVDPDRPTSDDSNWHSAAEDIGFATPGYQNSQFAPLPSPNGSITIEPAIFSPDNDGYQDVLTVAYRFDEPGFVGTMKVFDLAGREVRTLMNNELLGTSGAVSWDGLMDAQELARMGPYVVYMEAYDLNGNVEKFRKSVVLAHRL